MKQRLTECEALDFGPFRLIPSKRVLLSGEAPVQLGSRAFDILTLLLRHHGQVVSRREILDQVWPDLTIDEANLRVQMSELRRALNSIDGAAAYIKNVQGRGYVFTAPVQPVAPTEGSNASRDKTGLPARPQNIVGRKDAIEALLAQTLACRFVTLLGPGGIGKTTLAVELGHSLTSEFDHETYYVDLGSLKAPELVLPSIAAVLGYTVHSDNLLAGLATFVGDRRLLLIIDCCEHMIEVTAGAAATLFRNAVNLHLIATSREALRAEGETIYFVEPLELPSENERLTADEALAAGAVELFMQRASASGYVGKLDDNYAGAAAEICLRLDGNPLAIELAGSRLITYGFSGLLEGLRGRAVLSWPGRRHDSRHRSLEATLEWSFRLLSDVERRVLARLSVLIGPFTMRAAQALASNDIDDGWAVSNAVEELTDKSLISILPIEDSYAYRIPDVTRFYAEMKLAQSGERQDVLRRHAQFCVESLRDLTAKPRPSVGRVGLRNGLHLSNVRAALEWCFSNLGDIELGLDLAAGASRLMLEASLLGECLKWCEVALSHIDGNKRLAVRTLRLQESLALCRMYSKANDAKVEQIIIGALEIAAELGERESELELLAGYNLFLTRRADYLGALKAAERFASLAQTSRKPVEIAASEWMLGSTYNLLGNQRRGYELLERGHARATELGMDKVYYFGFDNKARGAIGRVWTSWLCGKPAKALQLAKGVLDSSVSHGHPVSLCITYLYTATVVLWLQEYDRAEGLIETLIEVANKYQLKPYRTGGMALKAELLLARGSTSAALALMKAVLEPLQAEQLNIILLPTMRAYAEALARTGDLEAGEAVISRLVMRARTDSPTYLLPELLRTQGEIVLRRDDQAAEECYRQAIEQAQIDGALGWELRASISLAKLCVKSARFSEAEQLLDRCLSNFIETLDDLGDVAEARKLIFAIKCAGSD